MASQQPGPQGQVNFGGSADDRNAYFGLNSGGIVALSLTNGERLWFTDIEPAYSRNRGQDAAVSTIPGGLFSGVLGRSCSCFGHERWKDSLDFQHDAGLSTPLTGFPQKAVPWDRQGLQWLEAWSSRGQDIRGFKTAATETFCSHSHWNKGLHLISSILGAASKPRGLS